MPLMPQHHPGARREARPSALLRAESPIRIVLYTAGTLDHSLSVAPRPTGRLDLANASAATGDQALAAEGELRRPASH